jgi:hypothetical protein
MVITKQFVFQVDPDGSIKFVGKSEDVLKKECNRKETGSQAGPLTCPRQRGI